MTRNIMFVLLALFAAAVPGVAATRVTLEAWALHQYDGVGRGESAQLPVPSGAQFHKDQWVREAFKGSPVTRIHFVTTVVGAGGPHPLNFPQTNSRFVLHERSGTPIMVAFEPQAFGQAFPAVELAASEATGGVACGVSRAVDGNDNSVFVLLTAVPAGE